MSEEAGTEVTQEPVSAANAREDAAYRAYEAHSGSPWEGWDGQLADEPENVDELRRFHMEITYGASWARPSLDMRTRSLVTVATLMTLGDQEDQLRRHLVRAERSGVGRAELVELMLHMTGYIGVPRVAKTLAIARKVWQGEANA